MNAILAPAAPLSAPSIDFADWLSPILVKELRQGLKSRVFVGTFIVMQVVMVITMGLRLLNQSTDGSAAGNSGFDGFFWALLWIPLLVLMPARGLTAVSEEARANTFDLMQLTRMTAFRIAFGKWIALVAQTVLLVAALLPYAVLRYYFGRVDVLSDLEIIGHMLLASMVLTAGAVALSAAHLAVRILVLVFMLPSFVMGIGGFMISMAFGGGSSRFSVVGGVSWWLEPFLTAVYVIMLLEFAAAKFAPLSENHPARKRTAALVLGVILIVATWLGGQDWFVPLLFSFVPLLGWVIVEALTERTVALPAIYTPFMRRGWTGRVLGRVLHPGWATAMIFTALVIVMMAVAIELLPKSVTTSSDAPLPLACFWPLIFFALVSPLPVMNFFPRVKQRFWLYVLVQCIFFLLFLATNIAAEGPFGQTKAVFQWLVPFPSSALMAILAIGSGHPDVVEFLAWGSGGFGLVMTAFMAIYMLREFRKISELERESVKPHAPEETNTV